MNLRWFNLSIPAVMLGPYRHRVFIQLFILFNRWFADGDRAWGVGLLQIGHGALFLVSRQFIADEGYDRIAWRISLFWVTLQLGYVYTYATGEWRSHWSIK